MVDSGAAQAALGLASLKTAFGGHCPPHLADETGSVWPVAKRGDARAGTNLHPPPPTWLARYRREAGLGQAEVANAAGISTRTLQRLESRDIPNPPVRYLVSCAVALGLDDWHLLLEDEWRKPLPGTRRVRRRQQ
jgi:DNA-binding XRE family transcriptional regulator